jgi:hypothetical protein
MLIEEGRGHLLAARLALGVVTALAAVPPAPGQRAQLDQLMPVPARALTVLVKTRLRQMQYRPGLLSGFLAKTHLDLTPLQ